MATRARAAAPRLARAISSSARQPSLKSSGVLKIGLIPADGIGREVIPVSVTIAICANSS